MERAHLPLRSPLIKSHHSSLPLITEIDEAFKLTETFNVCPTFPTDIHPRSMILNAERGLQHLFSQ